MATLTLVGAPFSTFTRTLRMAFHHMNIPYVLKVATPHSKLAKQYHPFGRIPSVLHNNLILFESATIRTYIDDQINNSLTPTDLTKRLKMETIISCLSDYVFHHVIFGVAKPRLMYEEKGLAEEEITSLLAKGPIDKAGKILAALNGLIDSDNEFLCGQEITWADYFVYPVMADLFCLPERDFFKEKAPRLFEWYEKFQRREEAVATYENTVAYLRSNQKASNL
ncbi:MAG: hypothetical protein EXX96DRAFT_575635 [Benjaminiella poitrasii]|nr:MAG: hypothetical protein EXX96DRAFT_575635 [Benjaminiella poitrasii]